MSMKKLMTFRVEAPVWERFRAYTDRLRVEAPAPAAMSMSAVALHLFQVGLAAEERRVSRRTAKAS